MRSNGERRLEFVPILLLVGFLPYCVFPGVFFYSDATPRACLLLLVIAILLCNGRTRAAFYRMRGTSTGKAFFAMVSLQVLWILGSCAFSGEPVLASFGTGWRRFGMVSQIAVLLCSVFTALHVNALAERAGLLVRVVAATGIPVALFGIAQYAGWDPLLHAAKMEFSEHIRPPGTFGNPTYYAGYLVFVVLCGLLVAFERQSPRWTSIGWLASLCGAFALLLTGTRSGILALMLGAVVLVSRSRPQWSRLSIVVSLTFSAVVAAFLISGAGAHVRARFRQWIQDPWGGPRLLLWRDSLTMVSAHPALGTGPETFASEFPHFQSAGLARAYPDFFEETAHNICLDSLASFGLPGLILLLGVSALGLFSPRTNGSQSAFPACIAAGFLAGQFTVFTIPTAVLYFVCIGASVGLQTAKSSVAAPESRESRATPPLVLVAAASLFAVIALQWGYVDFRWQSIKRRMNAGDLAGAMAGYASVSVSFPADPGLDLWYSRALASWIVSRGDRRAGTEESRQVLEAGQRACTTSPDRPNALYNLAILRALANDAEGEVAALRLAIQSAPNWYKPHLLLAETLLQEGDRDAARPEARLALELSGGKHPEAAQLLESALKD
jgi:O-antigen ligase